MNKVFCIGELLIDFISLDIGKNILNASKFEKKAGGAPANVAAAISKLGGQSYFLGQVGDDSFGKYLIETLESVKIDSSLVKLEGNTTLAFVAIDDQGERDFEFIRGSDGDYKFDNIDLSLIEANDIIHFGSATAFLEGELKESYFKFLEYAKENNLFISFDPNYRDLLIKEEYLEAYIENCKYFISKSDFVKFSLEELELISGESKMDKALDLIHNMGGKIVVITLGRDGSLLSYKGRREKISSITVKQLDSTGAGDAFVGGVLTKLSQEDNKKDIAFDIWKSYIGYGNKVGAITCTDYGAISSMPSLGFDE